MTDNYQSFVSDNISDMENEKNSAIRQIQELQTKEQQLYKDLEQKASDGSSTVDQQKAIVNEINVLSQLRKSLYDKIKTLYSGFQTDVVQTRGDLVDQTAVVSIIENELNDAKKILNRMETAKNNKLRMVEINTYYGKQYKSWSGAMKIIILTCIPLVIIALLSQASIIPQNLASALGVVIIVTGVVLFIYKMTYVLSRDNMEYDEFSWWLGGWNPMGDTPTVIDYDKKAMGYGHMETEASNLFKDAKELGQDGEIYCGKGTQWNAKHHKCLPN